MSFRRAVGVPIESFRIPKNELSHIKDKCASFLSISAHAPIILMKIQKQEYYRVSSPRTLDQIRRKNIKKSEIETAAYAVPTDHIRLFLSSSVSKHKLVTILSLNRASMETTFYLTRKTNIWVGVKVFMVGFPRKPILIFQAEITAIRYCVKQIIR